MGSGAAPRLRRILTVLAAITSTLFCITCDAGTAALPITIRQPLPDQESLSYSLLDSGGAKIGTAIISIQRQGDSLVLGQDYTDLQQHTDSGSVTVNATTMAPLRAHRHIHTASANSVLDVTYSGATVSTVSTAITVQRHEAKVTAATYDDAEIFFLMRTLEFTQGYTAHFNLVVVDTSKGTISRATASVRVNGTETITIAGKSYKAWQVALTGAGANSTAWYDTAPDRKLLRYNNPRQTSIELAGQ